MATPPTEGHERRAAMSLAALWQLLPVGLMWTRRSGSKLDQLAQGFAEEYANVEDRAAELLVEADPRATLELIAEWERVAGLPDACSGLTDLSDDPIEQRRDNLVAKLVDRGGQSIPFLLALARRFGWYITIREHMPGFVAGPSTGDPWNNGARSRAGDRLENQGAGWEHHFTVRAAGTPTVPFTAGSLAGERLRTWGDSTLECIIGRAKPAHSTVGFEYIWEEADDWSEWIFVDVWSKTPLRLDDEVVPLESHLPAYQLENLDSTILPSIYQDEVGVMEATGVWQWLQFMVKEPPAGSGVNAAETFQTQIWFGNSPPSPIGPSEVLWRWVSGVLTIDGGSGAPNAYVEDLGNGWYRATVGHASGAGQAGQKRWASIQVPEIGPWPTFAIWAAGVKFSSVFP